MCPVYPLTTKGLINKLSYLPSFDIGLVLYACVAGDAIFEVQKLF